jgi:IMP cyclohydrolase
VSLEINRQAQENLAVFAENEYPGRGIVLGMNEWGDMAMQVYFVMGRSDNSRNRVLVEEGGVVRTQAYDESKVEDPSLIIYNAMRKVDISRMSMTGDRLDIVSNGDQTDTVVDGVEQDVFPIDSLMTRDFEPDSPNNTPRITGLTITTENRLHYNFLSIIRKGPSGNESIHEFYDPQLLRPMQADGVGAVIHTYKGNSDPLPSYDREPVALPLGSGVLDTAEIYWNTLNEQNRVALVIKGIHLATRETEYCIVNAN